MAETATLFHAMTARAAGRACTAPPVSTPGQCEGCAYQHAQGQRKAGHIQPATHLCERCGKPSCADHLRYHARVEQFLCGYCFGTAERARRPMVVR